MAYLNEHEAAPSDYDDGEKYNPSPEEKQAIKLAEKIFDKNKKAKAGYDDRWNDYYAMFRGRQWKEKRPSYRHSEVINLIFREIQSGVPIQMDARPKFEYLPMEPGDIELAQILNQVCEADWNRFNWSEQLTEMVFDAWIFGTGIGGMEYDPMALNGKGQIVFGSKDPFYQFPSPRARDVNLDNCAHVEAEPMSLEEIKKRWPEKGHFVTADVSEIKRMDLFDKDRIKNQPSSTVRADSSQQFDGSDDKEAIVITLYLAPDYEIDEEEKTEAMEDGTVKTSYIKKKKYPKGRKLVVSNKVLLEDGENSREDSLFPYARLQNYVNQRQFWGISDVEQLESPQKVFNKLVSFALDVLTLMGNPVWKVGANSGVDTENLFNEPGLIIECTDPNMVQREEGVQLQPFVLQLIDRMKSWFDDVSGSMDVSRGAKPEGVTAASAIQSLQEAAHTRVRQKSRNLDACLQNLGQLYQGSVFQNYTAPQVFRLTNQDGSMKFFKFSVEAQANEMGEVKRTVKYRPFQEGEDGGLYEGEEKAIPVNGMLDLKVMTGSNLSFAKDAAKNEALQLFDRHIIDEEEVLKRFDYPNREAVLQRVMAMKAEAAQAEAMAGQPA